MSAAVASGQVRPDSSTAEVAEAERHKMNPVTLSFESKEKEDEYLVEVSRRRGTVLLVVFCFDAIAFLARAAADLLYWRRAAKLIVGQEDKIQAPAGTRTVFHITVMSAFWTLVVLMNRRSKGSDRARAKGKKDDGKAQASPNPKAARQEEFFLSAVGTLALTMVMASVTGVGTSHGRQYVFPSFIIICKGTLLELRWWNATLFLAIPALVFLLRVMVEGSWPVDAGVHVLMAWASGALMSFMADKKRREVFLNHKIAEAAASAKAAAEAKSDFMRIMCHEVRTPLNGCIASAEMLLSTTSLSKEQEELVKTIEVSSQHLLATVSSFLDFFKLSAGRSLEKVEAEVRIDRLANDVHRIAEKLVQGRDTQVTIREPNIEPSCPQAIVSDPHRLRGVLLNLVSNACKATSRGSVTINVSRIRSDVPQDAGAVASSHPNHEPPLPRERDFILFEVSDTGCGIAPDQLQHLFKDYVQASAPSQTSLPHHGGTGLGLSICKRQVAALSGKIGARSEVNRGSTFWFTVPLVLPSSANGKVDAQRATNQARHKGFGSEEKGAANEEETRKFERRLKGQQVLVAEDNAINQAVMRRLLETIGVSCSVVANGAEAVELIERKLNQGTTSPAPSASSGETQQQQQPDICAVLMDMQMPVLSGLEATQQIRSKGFTLPIVGVTANAMDDDKRACLDYGMNDVLVKPLTKEKLSHVLGSVAAR